MDYSNKTMLKNKNILFIGYKYYNYHEKITEAIKNQGGNVNYFPVFKYNIWFTLSRRISFKLFLRYNKINADKILKAAQKKQYDIIFIMQGFQLADDFYLKLKKQQPSAYMVNYHWDSVRMTEFKRTLLDTVKYFDKAYSFDRLDCEKNKELNYLPLFYIDDYKNSDQNNGNKDIDLLFIGSISKYRRYELIKKIEEQCKAKGLNFITFLHINKNYYWRLKLKGKELRGTSFKSISQQEIVDYYKRSKAVIDLPNQKQSGLTMRTFEVLGFGNKLITTNTFIKKEPFYNSDYIEIIDEKEPIITPGFIFNNNKTGINVTNYSINEWIKKILLDETKSNN